MDNEKSSRRTDKESIKKPEVGPAGLFKQEGTVTRMGEKCIYLYIGIIHWFGY